MHHHLLPALALVPLLLAACGGKNTEPSEPATTDAPSTETGTSTTDTTGTTGTDPTGSTGTGTGTTGATSTTAETGLPIVGTAPLQFRGQQPTRVLMISVDTFRKDHIGAYGTKNLTPRIDQLIADGVALDDHMQCANWTYPTTTCTLLGRRHVDNGFLPSLLNPGRAPFPAGTDFLATWLTEAGYDTAISSRNGWLSEEWNSVQGHTHILPAHTSLQDQTRIVLDHLRDVPAGTPWYVHIHATEPHTPYTPPEEYRTGLKALDPIDIDLDDRDVHYDAGDDWPTMTPEEQQLLEAHMRVRYEGEIDWFDDQLADALVAFDKEGFLQNTLVVFWNDHGEQFWENGNQTHAYDLYGEENDGFAVFWAKNIVPVRHSGPTHAVDVAPTILSAVGVPVPPAATGYVLGTRPADAPRYAWAVARLGPISSVVRGSQKMIFDWDQAAPVRYDRSVDPDERVDLWGTDPKVDMEMWGLLQEDIERIRTVDPGLQVIWPFGLEP